MGGNRHPLGNLPEEVSATGALENQEGRAQRCLWDVLSLPAPATCGSPFPSPLILLQLPALLGIRLALSRDFPDHLGRNIPAFPGVGTRGSSCSLLSLPPSLLCSVMPKPRLPKYSQFSEQSFFPSSPEPPGPVARACKSFLFGCANTSGSKATP